MLIAILNARKIILIIPKTNCEPKQFPKTYCLSFLFGGKWGWSEINMYNYPYVNFTEQFYVSVYAILNEVLHFQFTMR